MSEQTPVDSPSVEDRLNSFFTPPSEVSQGTETQEVTQETAPEVVEEAPPEGEEFDFDGEVVVLPPSIAAKAKEWKEGYERRSDYTQKTQQLAEITRQAAAVAETLEMSKRFDEHVAQEKTELAQISHQLSQFKNVNWSELGIEQHLSLRQQMESLKERKDELAKSISEKNEKFTQWKDSKKAEVLQAGSKYLTQAIKEWGPQAMTEVAQRAKDVGYSDEEIKSVLDARFVHLAWEAAQYRKLQAAKPQAVAAAQKAPPVLKPGASQGPGVAAEQKYRESRAALKKSGSLQDAARLFMLRG